jgi:hypothetical protein
VIDVVEVRYYQVKIIETRNFHGFGAVIKSDNLVPQAAECYVQSGAEVVMVID